MHQMIIQHLIFPLEMFPSWHIYTRGMKSRKKNEVIQMSNMREQEFHVRRPEWSWHPNANIISQLFYLFPQQKWCKMHQKRTYNFFFCSSTCAITQTELNTVFLLQVWNVIWPLMQQQWGLFRNISDYSIFDLIS